jgi:vacuolar protein sorting-associated protein 13A/C
LIEDVFLLAAPRSDQEVCQILRHSRTHARGANHVPQSVEQYNEEEEDQRRQTLKMERLQNAELLQEKSTAGMSQEEEKKNQSFAASLITKVGH